VSREVQSAPDLDDKVDLFGSSEEFRLDRWGSSARQPGSADVALGRVRCNQLGKSVKAKKSSLSDCPRKKCRFRGYEKDPSQGEVTLPQHVTIREAPLSLLPSLLRADIQR
jgi:hypothetical protein